MDTPTLRADNLPRKHGRKARSLVCPMCSKAFVTYWHSVQFCSKSCSSRHNWKHNADTMLRVTRENMAKGRAMPEAAEKLREWSRDPSNPIYSKAARNKARASQDKRGYAYLNGGMGSGLSKPQEMLAKRLGWQTEYVVKTGWARPPYRYIVDIVSVGARIAIEVDGESHRSNAVRARDIAPKT